MAAVDPYVWPRECVADKPNQAWCTVCWHRFASPTAFDLHRGIQVRPRREDSQDKGRCAPTDVRLLSGLVVQDRIWYTPADVIQKTRLDEARNIRELRKVS